MRKRLINSVLIFVLCTGIFTGCNLFPLRQEVTVTQPNTPGQQEDMEEENEEDEDDVIAPVEISEDVIMYCSSAVNVRTMPSTQGSVIGELSAGQKVTVTGKEGGWYEIVFEGERAYVYENYLTDEK